MKIAISGSQTKQSWYGKVPQLKLALQKLGHDVFSFSEKVFVDDDCIKIHITSDMTNKITPKHFLYEKIFIGSPELIFVSNKEILKKYFNKIPNSFYLPCAVDTSIYKPLNGVEEEFDIGFVGKNYKTSDNDMDDRTEIIQILKSKYKCHFFINPNKRIFFEKANEAYNRCKIIFNMSLSEGVNMRIFEGCATGKLTVTNRIPNIEELYTDKIDKKDIVLWDDFQDLTDKIDYYLAHDKERWAIGQQGRITTVKKHDYIARAKFIEQCILNHNG